MEGNKKYSVYIHTNKNNGKNYVGITSMKPERRWGRDGQGYFKKKNGKYCQPAFANAIIKYGWDSFSHEIIATDLSFEEASELEIQKISELKSDNPKHGYNIEKGGRYSKAAESTVKKMVEGHKGYKHSEETKRKISESNMGKVYSDSSKEKLSASHSKIKQEPDTSIQPNYIYNEVQCKCVETGTCYHSIEQAAKSVGSYNSNILKCLNGERKRAGGYHWARITKEEYNEYYTNLNIQ